MQYIPIVALFISLASFAISVASYRRSGALQDFDYAARMQVVDEQIGSSSPSLKDRPAFSYAAAIENRGAKPVKISDIYLDYGHKENERKRIKFHLEGETYLPPGAKHAVAKSVSWEDVNSLKEKFGIGECFFFLRIVFIDAKSRKRETARILSGFDGDTTVMFAQRGDVLS